MILSPMENGQAISVMAAEEEEGIEIDTEVEVPKEEETAGIPTASQAKEEDETVSSHKIVVISTKNETLEPQLAEAVTADHESDQSMRSTSVEGLDMEMIDTNKDIIMTMMLHDSNGHQLHRHLGDILGTDRITLR